MVFSAKDRATILQLAETLTGATLLAKERQDFFLRKVATRVAETGTTTLSHYLQRVSSSKHEFEMLISNLTIHTTSWFREMPHYKSLEEHLIQTKEYENKILYVWSAACSSGEEVYSLALMLWRLRQEKIVFDFRIVGTDLDPKSIELAKRALYLKHNLKNIDRIYHSYLLEGMVGKNEYITIVEEIRSRCLFKAYNLLSDPWTPPKNPGKSTFDVVICRNVLIYFDLKEQKGILKNLSSSVKNNGLLILGHSDTFFSQKDLIPFRPSMYFRKKMDSDKDTLVAKEGGGPSTARFQAKKGNILILNASPAIKNQIAVKLQGDFDVSDGKSSEFLDLQGASKNLDLIVLDLTLSEKGGMQWLISQRQNELQLPVVVLCESTSSEAINIFNYLETGIQEFITKKDLQEQPELILEICQTLVKKPIKENVLGTVENLKSLHPFRRKAFRPEVIVIGASTGGPGALALMLKKLPKNLPPIIVVQHISPEFSSSFAFRMSQISGLRDGFQDLNPGSAESKSILLEEGCIYLAKGDYHLNLVKTKDGIAIEKNFNRKTNGHRPSIDVLFESIPALGIESMAVILTGMGQDGALGLLKLAKSDKCFTMAQDEQSSVVYGMPKKALESGAACYVGNILEIRAEMLKRLGRR